MSSILNLVPIAYQVESSQLDFRPYGVVIARRNPTGLWAIHVNSSKECVTREGFLQFVDQQTPPLQFKSPEKALTFWLKIRTKFFYNYPEIGYAMKFYTDEEASAQRSKIGWDHITKLINKIKNKKSKKDKNGTTKAHNSTK